MNLTLVISAYFGLSVVLMVLFKSHWFDSWDRTFQESWQRLLVLLIVWLLMPLVAVRICCAYLEGLFSRKKV